MTKMHPIVRTVLIVLTATVTVVVLAGALLVAGDDSSTAATNPATTTAAIDTGGEPATTTAAPATTTTSPPVENATVADIAEQFRITVNGKDATAVAALAPGTQPATLEFLIGGGPYEKVDCYIYEGEDECTVANGIAVFTFLVDTNAKTVTKVTYVGGE